MIESQCCEIWTESEEHGGTLSLCVMIESKSKWMTVVLFFRRGAPFLTGFSVRSCHRLESKVSAESVGLDSRR